MIEHASDLILLINEEGTIIYASPSIEAKLGYPPAEVIGKPVLEFLRPDGVGEVRQSLRDAQLHSDDALTMELQALHADGTCRVLEAVCSKLLHVPAAEFMVIAARDITERKEAEDRLIESHSPARQLAAKLQHAREDERERIAREIHDDLGQMMTSLLLKLESLAFYLRRGGAPDLAVDRIQDMIDDVQANIRSVQKTLSELRPVVLERLGLGAAIEWQARQFTATTGIAHRMIGFNDKLGLDSGRSLQVFRIFQEVLTNVARHSAATEVLIDLALRDGRLSLSVADNGRGIDVGRILDPGSLGLLGMRERTFLLGGLLEIRRVSPHGTEVRLEIPIEGGAMPQSENPLDSHGG